MYKTDLKIMFRGINYSILIMLVITSCTGSFLNKNVERIIDLKSHLVKISHKIIAENLGAPNEPYIFSIPLAECEHLAFISARDKHMRQIYLKKTSSYGCEYAVDLNQSLTLHVDTIYSKLVKPHPKEITQSEKQLVKYLGNMYFYSPYKSLAQVTTLVLGSQNILFYSKLKPVSVKSNVVQFGPFEDILDYSISPLETHFENQSPFLTVTYLERSIEVSHWGNIAVEENIHLTHSGALLKGPFSRYELQKDIRSGQSAIKSYKTILPAAATSIYYRDGNGNISTSNINIIPDAVELELRPRFSLFGGWKTDYILGYNVPSFEYLFNRGQHFLLKMRVIDHIYDDMIIDEAIVKIILPEGSAHIELTTPYAVSRGIDVTYYTYLDTIGRPVVTFSKRNLVENHILDFNLKYTFWKLSMLQEPFLVVASIFSLFVIVIIYNRLDFSISKRENNFHKD